MVLILVSSTAVRVEAQEHLVYYSAPQLSCAVYRVTIHSTVTTERGSAKRTEDVGWDGRILLTAEAAPDGSMAIVGWFEQLEVWRETPEGRTAPATSGLIGGRYRGRLDPAGRYRREAVPFLPEAITAIADLATAFDELVPPAPNGPLAPGESSIDSLGWHYDRLSDTTWNDVAALRFRLVHRDSSVVEADFGRGQQVEGTSLEAEHGRVVWVEGSGPALWTRRITTTVSFPPASLTPEAVLTHIDQRRRVERVETAAAPRCSVE